MRSDASRPGAANWYIPAVQKFDVIVLGGGAAGLMCAAVAGQRGRRVLVLERANRPGKKILMSGGGRCNFTNLNCEPAHFLSANPDFCVSALRRYTPADFLALVEKHGIAWDEKEAGQLFCDHSARDILAMLESECEAAGVRTLTACEVTSVDSNNGYRVSTNRGQFHASSLVIATGGLSIPTLGGSDFGYRLARQFGLNVLPTRAGLVPFTFTDAIGAMMGRLSGTSVPATLRCAAASFRGNVLFTHRGLSGPAALQLSSYWNPGEPIELDRLPGRDAAAGLLQLKSDQPRSLLRSALSGWLPRALVSELETLWWPQSAQKPLAEFPGRELQQIGELLGRWSLKPSGTEGYRTAEVTLGGIDTSALSSKTMECRHQPGLYCIGEVVDVTGQLGGFNFQWAWASGHAAGQVA